LCGQIPKAQKRLTGCLSFFALSGSACVKAACQRLMKLPLSLLSKNASSTQLEIRSLSRRTDKQNQVFDLDEIAIYELNFRFNVITLNFVTVSLIGSLPEQQSKLFRIRGNIIVIIVIRLIENNTNYGRKNTGRSFNIFVIIKGLFLIPIYASLPFFITMNENTFISRT